MDPPQDSAIYTIGVLESRIGASTCRIFQGVWALGYLEDQVWEAVAPTLAGKERVDDLAAATGSRAVRYAHTLRTWAISLNYYSYAGVNGKFKKGQC